MLKKAAKTLMLLPLLAATTFAQGPNTTTTMVCRTDDGTLRISDRSIALADYHLTFDTVVKDGVLQFSDARTGAVAVLDARDAEGLFLEVTEGGVRMQLVANRADIRYEENERGTAPASSSYSSVLQLISVGVSNK